MTGLLHRLAARATGTTLAVRSDSRLPFSTAGAFSGAAAIFTPTSLAFGTRAPVLTSAAAPPDVPEQMRIDVPGLSPPRAPHADSPRWATLDAGRDPHPSFSGSTPEAAQATTTAAVPPPMVSTSIEERHVSPFRESVAEPIRRSAAHELESASRDGATRVVRDPPLLIPLAAPDRAAVPAVIAPPGARTPLGMTQPAGRAEPADVHIHIGRVEVTAVHEAAPPRRQPRPGPEPMSLDAYFARRGRG